MEQGFFSRRMGVRQEMTDIVIRNDAPEELRGFLFFIVGDYIKSLEKIRHIVCKIINKAPNSCIWGEGSYMESEIQELLQNCKWYCIYDIIEGLYEEMDSNDQVSFESKINEFFCENGIGWKLEQGLIIYRGDGPLEGALHKAKESMEEKGLTTSKREIEEAIADLSRRPSPEITGAVQHAVVALECVCRKLTDSKDTLGQCLKSHPDIVPRPLDDAVSKMYGYASEHARHLCEGGEPSYNEAFLLVHISASLCAYLTNKFDISERVSCEL